MFVSKLNFSTKSPSISSALCQRETSVCMSCWNHSLSCPCSQVLITSSTVLNFTPQTAFLGLRRGENLKVLGRGSRVDGVTLSKQILLLLPASSNLCVVLHCHLYYFVHKWMELQRRPTWALAFLRSICQLKYPAIASSDFVTRVFSRVGLSAPTPKHLEGRCFLSGLSPLVD
jgi:hypothetical protein